MTEEEAKTKWCPFAKEDYKDAECIGSKCMAWRWALEPDPNFKPTHPMMDTHPRNPATDPSPWRASTTNGYCGLAGRL